MKLRLSRLMVVTVLQQEQESLSQLESKVLQQVLPPSQQVEHGNTIRIQQQGFVSKIQKNP